MAKMPWDKSRRNEGNMLNIIASIAIFAAICAIHWIAQPEVDNHHAHEDSLGKRALVAIAALASAMVGVTRA